MAALDAKLTGAASQASGDAPPVSQFNISDYAAKAVSFLARNFYTLKYVALVLAFCINFVLLFYKATSAMTDEEDGDAEGGSGDGESAIEEAAEELADVAESIADAVSNATEAIVNATQVTLQF